MQFRKIGNSDLEVSAVALGTWVFGGDCWGPADDARSENVVAEAIERGINLIDTAPVYGGGRSEEVIGRAIKGKRDRVVVATKCGLQKQGRAIRPNLTAAFIREEIENSLRRLGVDMIDLYQCHWPDDKTSFEETFTELNNLAEEGKIKHIGVSNFSRGQLEEAMSFAPVVSNQIQYSIFERSVEKELLPFCVERNVSFLTYGSLGGGILTGKYSSPPALPKGDVRSFFYKYYGEPFWSRGRELMHILDDIAGKRGVPVAHVAINWVLANPGVASCIAGARAADQVCQNAAAASWALSAEEMKRIQTGYDCVFPEGSQ
jgi:methylglyoxal reductase